MTDASAISSAIDPATLPELKRTNYPAPHSDAVAGRGKKPLGILFGLTQFGVNLTTLAPGAWSAHRHWHQNEDEFIFVVSGHPTLITDDGSFPLAPGMVAGFPAGKANGHHLVNSSTEPVTYLEIGSRAMEEVCHYPDIDLVFKKNAEGFRFTRRDGTPF